MKKITVCYCKLLYTMWSHVTENALTFVYISRICHSCIIFKFRVLNAQFSNKERRMHAFLKILVENGIVQWRRKILAENIDG